MIDDSLNLIRTTITSRSCFLNCSSDLGSICILNKNIKYYCFKNYLITNNPLFVIVIVFWNYFSIYSTTHLINKYFTSNNKKRILKVHIWIQ